MHRIYNVTDLFAGAGGFGLGFQMSTGFKLNCSLEIDKWAVDTIKTNSLKGHKIINADIRDFISGNSIKKAVKIIPNVIIGGPPCQGFSIQGPAAKKDPNDPRNSLFIDFARWVDKLNPDVFIMENVTGILSRQSLEGKKVIKIIIETFQSLDYSVNIWKLNAANYGVPQLRERVFIVGNKYGGFIPEPDITHGLWTSYYSKKKLIKYGLRPAITVGQAITDLPYIKAGEGSEMQEYTKKEKNNYQTWARANNEHLYNHVAMNHTRRLVERFKHIQKGTKIVNLPDELKVRERNGNGTLSMIEFNSNYRHLKSNHISYTIPASFYSSFIHPFVPRNITTREAARIQSFPDSYKFEGKRTMISSKLLKKLGKENENHLSQYNQVGNAVPPLLAKAIAEHIKVFLDDKLSV